MCVAHMPRQFNLCEPGRGITRKLQCAQASFQELCPPQSIMREGAEAPMVMAVTVMAEVTSKKEPF